MRIDENLCVKCGLCIAYCPVNAIYPDKDTMVIDQEMCTECGTCGRQRIVPCPTKAIQELPSSFEYPRSIRKYFSDPTVTHIETKIPGRGTEEVKTNDVTGRVKNNEYGISIEVGRPAISASFIDFEKITMALAKHKVIYEECNPVKALFLNESLGILKPEVKRQRVTSCIIEFAIPRYQLESVLKTLLDVANHIETVFSLGVIAHFDSPYRMPEIECLERFGIKPRPNNKINLGLGRPLSKEK